MRQPELTRRRFLGYWGAAIGAPLIHNFPWHAPLTVPRWSNDFNVVPDASFRFTQHERETIEAAMVAIIPWAGEARAVDYIVRHVEDSFAARVYAANHDPDNPVWIPPPPAKKKGWQREIKRLQDLYRRGVAYMDCLAQKRYGRDFKQLTLEERAEILHDMDASSGPVGVPLQTIQQRTGRSAADPCSDEDPTIYDFFDVLFFHTVEGCYCDPVYGGNKDRIGWKKVRFPGPADGLPGALVGYSDDAVGEPPD